MNPYTWTIEVKCLDCDNVIKRTYTSIVSREDAMRRAEAMVWIAFDRHVAENHI